MSKCTSKIFIIQAFYFKNTAIIFQVPIIYIKIIILLDYTLGNVGISLKSHIKISKIEI